MVNKLKQFIQSESANFAMIFGLTLAPVLMSVGLAVDYSAHRRIDSRIQDSADISLLGASKALVRAIEEDATDDGYPLTIAEYKQILIDKFTPYFEANAADLPVEIDEDSFSFDYEPEVEKATLSIKAEYRTAVFQAFGTKTLPIKIIQRLYSKGKSKTTSSMLSCALMRPVRCKTRLTPSKQAPKVSTATCATNWRWMRNQKI